jgi:hypothetical protein
MSVPLRYGSVFDAGSVRVIEPFVLNLTCFRTRCVRDDEEFQVSHVNSPDRRNPANATQSAALRLRLSLLFDSHSLWEKLFRSRPRNRKKNIPRYYISSKLLTAPKQQELPN